MTRRLRLRPAPWLAALCATLAAGQPARAQEPVTAVEVTVVGTAGDLERVRGLAPRLAGGGARWLRAEKLEPADVLRDRAEGETDAVRAWVDLTLATRARLTFATRDRFIVRDLDLSGRFDEVDRAALAEVLESSIGALVANERAGLTRVEAEAVLAARAPLAAPPVVLAPPAKPPAPTAADAGPSPSRWALGFFYGAQAQGQAPAVDHGPGVAVSWAATQKFANVHEAGRGPAVFASAQVRPPTHEHGARIGVGLYTIAARAGVECGPLLWSRLRVRLGGGADFVNVTPESSDPGAAVGPARWSTSFVATAALRVNLVRPARRFWLSAALSADVLPTAVSYDATVDGVTTSVFSPWRVRPGITLESAFF